MDCFRSHRSAFNTVTSEESEDANGDIEEEDGPPAVQAAQHGAQGEGGSDDDGLQANGPPSLLRRKG